VYLQSCHRCDGNAWLEGYDSVALPSRSGRVPCPRKPTEPAARATEEARQGDDGVIFGIPAKNAYR